MKRIVFASLFLLLAGVTLRAADYDVRKYGAKGDGVKMNTEAIQKAIDACSKAGGGRVVLSDGVYLTGPIQLKDGVDLHLERTARLLASPNIEDFPDWKDVKHVNSENLPRGNRNACMIFADEAERIAITGHGVIDGNGTHHIVPLEKPGNSGKWFFKRKYPNEKTLPRVVFFAGCKDVVIEDVTMTNQPSGWSYWIHDCDRVMMRGLHILAELRYPNNDGIHINCSRDVTVSDCHIQTGDDCIIIRANSRSLKENKPLERVVVTNCILRTCCYGIRIAFCNDGVMRNCTFSNLVITDSRDGIGITLPNSSYPRNYDFGREKSLVENMVFSNIVMDGIYGRPIYAFMKDKNEVDAVRDIHFSNIRATANHFPIFCGREGNPLQRFSFDNCSFVRVSEPGQKEDIIFQHVEGFVFNNTTFETR
ncbi:MAG: hypothetical protein IJV01_02905 [Bacteroidales bacterium]|nr:hypothetical protein [Bacteroidales bacterium]